LRADLLSIITWSSSVVSFQCVLLSGDFNCGIADNGRVWEDGENVNVIHTGCGGALDQSVFLAVLTATYSFSNEKRMALNVKLGWWF
jgi:hypothetical protein